jgi:hypothetical protein
MGAAKHMTLFAFFVQQLSPAPQVMHIAQFALVQKDPKQGTVSQQVAFWGILAGHPAPAPPPSSPSKVSEGTASHAESTTKRAIAKAPPTARGRGLIGTTRRPPGRFRTRWG